MWRDDAEKAEGLDAAGQFLKRIDAPRGTAGGVLDEVVPALLADDDDKVGGAVLQGEPDDDGVALE